MLYLILTSIWVLCLLFLFLRDRKAEAKLDEEETLDTPKSDSIILVLIDRIARIYVFVFAAVMIVLLIYKLIWFFSSIHFVVAAD